MTHLLPGAGIDELRGRAVLVAGLGASGRSAVEALTELGAQVTAVDSRDMQDVLPPATELPSGVRVLTDSDPTALAERAWEFSPSLVVASPGWSPAAPLLTYATASNVPIWSEVELAWQVCPAHVRWLTLTGTNGKTTTVGMLAAMLTAHGWNAPAVGNVGTPIAATVLGARAGDGPGIDALAVELSSFQLHYTHSVSAVASACLNVDADHLDWHGSMDAYVAAKERVHHSTKVACIYNVADPRTREMVAEADVIEGARAVGFTHGSPSVGELGMVEDVLADRAFVANRQTHAAELGSLTDLEHLGSDGDVPPHIVANALAAAALARAAGVDSADVASGLRAYSPGEHRMQTIATLDGVRYIDDSKATNAHAAAAALSAMEAGRTIWIAGGLAKGARLDDLVAAHRDKVRAVVVIGVDQRPVLEALERHAPGLPRHVVPGGDTEVMRTAVDAARAFAQPGDVVLLAPACASMDQFRSYAARGEAFADAVRELES
ncbi:UDP-N-acetylmuramoyl-L-alanine--D-glutamate ligase [Ruania halotolerans]|uniref:UDP-N-acetylmuramoyl-L-alanine--D-glutamate ligase n=1 Tax=Ruania halotolerans TaxID=2897773 RepID=UPI001E4928EA|nr:UDP-N-acetylmuramoyl-L-alanine--D-glutamate ligase [Ruania halotolerans]UFU05123.1 UDP-N-acetylmuramoyl-L-alanine--D-glutamate ligase [Ruania halotolerans]